ncbi:serine/arginine-rich SC35-like splicing factor SCL28 [Iris pallida]|uniref:Serine/arginine-rich SC35-like splicing factor SCL28 n=1 Tax=Iris pallida TaxID=29817 RepID=A0AAX6I513_IRIPA|nr:serine/arginine-rich SC35-like splicing factor SCL28 [Iris pallida]
MGRYRSRSRSRSYSPRRFSRSPPRRKRYDDPRDRYPRGVGGGGGGGRSFRDRRSDAPSGLLIRNISLDARPEDLRVPFERFGPVRDVYLPKNYYTGEPRGFGFVKFRNAEDAAEAKHHMNHQVIGGREISIVYAEENRKTPQEMRSTGRISGRYGGDRRSPPRSSRSPRRRYRSYSRSPSPRHSPSSRYDSRERGRGTHDDYSPRQRSITPSPRKEYKSGQRSPSPVGNSRSPSRSRSYSPH